MWSPVLAEHRCFEKVGCCFYRFFPQRLLSSPTLNGASGLFHCESFKKQSTQGGSGRHVSFSFRFRPLCHFSMTVNRHQKLIRKCLAYVQSHFQAANFGNVKPQVPPAPLLVSPCPWNVGDGLSFTGLLRAQPSCLEEVHPSLPVYWF